SSWLSSGEVGALIRVLSGRWAETLLSTVPNSQQASSPLPPGRPAGLGHHRRSSTWWRFAEFLRWSVTSHVLAPRAPGRRAARGGMRRHAAGESQDPSRLLPEMARDLTIPGAPRAGQPPRATRSVLARGDGRLGSLGDLLGAGGPPDQPHPVEDGERRHGAQSDAGEGEAAHLPVQVR